MPKKSGLCNKLNAFECDSEASEGLALFHFIVLQLHPPVLQGQWLLSDSGGTDMYDHITAGNDRLAGHWQ